MATCNGCGAEIEFRYVDGRCVPIHPGGGWHCGSSHEVARHVATPRLSRAGEWARRDFAHASQCPECGKPVFFIRHNGGSVWLDELGWPWPKHGCFDQPRDAAYVFKAWSAKSTGLTNPRLAMITRIREDLDFGEPIVEVRFPDSSRASLILRRMQDTASLLGALVAVSQEDHLLVHPYHAEQPFHSYTPLASTDADGYFRCPRCNTWTNESTGHEAWCREQAGTVHHRQVLGPSIQRYGSAQCPQCKVWVSHLTEHERHCRARPGKAPEPTAPETDGGQTNPGGARKPSRGGAGPRPPKARRERSGSNQGKPEDLAKAARIERAVDEVSRLAWEGVNRWQPRAKQVDQATRRAGRFLRLLPHDIRDGVRHRMTMLRWRALRDRRPW